MNLEQFIELLIQQMRTKKCTALMIRLSAEKKLGHQIHKYAIADSCLDTSASNDSQQDY